MTRDLPTKRDLRKFGITLGTALLVLALVLYLKDRPAYIWFAGVGAFLLLTGLVLPVLLRSAYRVWMTIAFALGWFNTRLLLGIIFYVIFTPVGLIMRLLQRDALNLRFHRNTESHWVYREDRTIDPKRMERMA